jgi:hypothetical protein
MKTKPKPRARRMWANYYPYGPVLDTFDSKARAMSWAKDHPATATVPVAVIPLHDFTTLGDSMVSALTSLGVLPRARAKKGRK